MSWEWADLASEHGTFLCFYYYVCTASMGFQFWMNRRIRSESSGKLDEIGSSFRWSLASQEHPPLQAKAPCEFQGAGATKWLRDLGLSFSVASVSSPPFAPEFHFFFFFFWWTPWEAPGCPGWVLQYPSLINWSRWPRDTVLFGRDTERCVRPAAGARPFL